MTMSELALQSFCEQFNILMNTNVLNTSNVKRRLLNYP